MTSVGLRINSTGIVAFLRYLWSLPIVRRIAGWLLQLLLTKVFNWLRSLKPKEKRTHVDN